MYPSDRVCHELQLGTSTNGQRCLSVVLALGSAELKWWTYCSPPKDSRIDPRRSFLAELSLLVQHALLPLVWTLVVS